MEGLHPDSAVNARQHTPVTGVERFFKRQDIIVSKTNLKGHITYANRTFIDISGYSENELLLKPHSILRHPDMPRSVFKLLWDMIEAKREIFAYVVNLCKNGDHYWVLAHVTPSLDTQGNVIGYHSNRRVPSPRIVQEAILPLYRQLSKIEEENKNRKQGMQDAYEFLQRVLKEKGMAYDEFIFSLGT
ncbi:MAG: PAS domain-containing protein [Alphaproteobacteria bacterium]|nr:PAS domain-containing protein [Alphaproteobacteria bacterium]